MTHLQILEKLAAKTLVQSLDEDLSRLVSRAMSGARHNASLQPIDLVLPRLLQRWNCVLEAADEAVSPAYRQKTRLALAVQLHKHGFATDSITQNALQAIDYLDEKVVLSDAFSRQAAEIKAFLQVPPTPSKRRPAIPDAITFYRPKDLLAIQVGKVFHAAYVHELTGPNESPVLEFYADTFEELPTAASLAGKRARGNARGQRELAGVYGLKFTPDPANQVTLLAACVEETPESSHLAKPTALYTMSDLFSLFPVK